MCFPMTNSRTNHIKLSYYEKHNIITKPKFVNIRIINIMMYVTINFLCKTPIYLRMLFYWPIKLWDIRRNNFENVNNWKKLKIHSEKNLSWFSLEPFKKIIAHNTIQCLKNFVHYLDMKMPDILVEIIYLKLFS